MPYLVYYVECIPMITNTAIDCGTVESPPNGQVLLLHGTTLGSSAMYNCFQGFLLLGTTIRRCEANGEWSSVEPSCSRKLHV